jgi:S-adenosylmethionine:tRNA ribosyltransferase-isomerase
VISLKGLRIESANIMKLSEFDYELPENLIAQEPALERTSSRMLVLHRETGEIEHKGFSDILSYLTPRELLVINNTKVFPARLYGLKEGGSARIEVLLTKKIEENIWEVMMKPAKRLDIGEKIKFDEVLEGVVLGKNMKGRRYIKFEPFKEDFMTIVNRIGKVPLPPYIKRDNEQEHPSDRERYQTVFARRAGSVAAPTAGLHFDNDILKKLSEKRVETCEVTLNVGTGSFTPVNTEEIEDFKIDMESYELTRSSARKIEEAIMDDRTITAVGTTVVRTLESAFLREGTGRFRSGVSNTDLFIYPGFKFNIVSKLLTNFHIPKSTLLMLVCAFAGKDKIMRAYAEAVTEKYRFYSFGDCMLIL